MDQQQIALKTLDSLYNAFDEHVGATLWACESGCAVCCTDRVMVTTLEMQVLAAQAQAVGSEDALEALAAKQVDSAARPATTPNQLARLFLGGQEPPEEAIPAAGPGVCPFLNENAACSVYKARPMACRMMLSVEKCEPGRQARMDEWQVTLGLVFSQLVEQVAVGGGYGLMADVYASVRGETRPLLNCENLPGIPAPPRQQQRLEQTLQRVMAKPVHNGLPLGHWISVLQR